MSDPVMYTPEPISAPLDAAMGIAIDGVALFASDAVRNGLNRLLGGRTTAANPTTTPAIPNALLLGLAAAAMISALLAARRRTTP